MNDDKIKEKTNNQYCDKLKEFFQKYTDEDGGTKFPIPEEIPFPKNGDWWGPWRYNARVLSLEYYDGQGNWRYEVDLERCKNCADIMDWIFQLNTKAWCTYEEMGHLVKALGDLLHPQQNVVHRNPTESFDVVTYLRRRTE